MRIYLDNIVFSIQKSGGISVVWKNIITALLESEFSDFKSLEYEKANNNICRRGLSLQNVDFRKNRVSFGVERYLNPIVDFDKPFIFHSSYYRTCDNENAINVTTVHDFTYELFRHGMSRQLHCWQKYKAIRKSDLIVCITENTKRDLIKYLPDVDPMKIRVIYNGVSDNFYRLAIKPDMGLGKYVVFIGWRVPYKNFNLTVEALKDTDLNLVIVGAPLERNEIQYLDKMLGKDHYRSFVQISDEELNKLYNSAYCLAYPSEYEGFGIPVIEAQKAGCPVIAFNGSSIPEVIGPSPLLINTPNIEDFKEKLDKLNDLDLRQNVINNGFNNAMRFSWEKMGKEYLEIYRELASRKEL